MSVAVALWSAVVKPGEPETIVTPEGVELHITNVALGATLEDESARTTVQFTYNSVPKPDDMEEDSDEEDDEDEGGDKGGEPITTVLASLTPGKIEQALVNVVLDGDSMFQFEVVGKNTIHLTGNYIHQGGPDSDIDSDDEDLYDLGDAGSDVEIDAAELDQLEGSDDEGAGRFEEIVEKPKGKKRPAEALDADEPASKLSKAERKALKKQKGADGEAVPAAPAPEAKKDDEKKKEKKEKKKADAPAPTTKELAGGLKVRDVKQGDGPAAKPGQTIKMRYIGKLENGKIFDQNTKGAPFSFRLGSGEVIKGWDQGLVGMKVGGERLLTIPPALAYGKRKQADIPANSTLIFEVKMIGMK